MEKYYPVFLNIQGKKCVVVGGGNVAWRKVCSLKEAVVVIASTDDEEVNKKIYYDAIKRGQLANVVDKPEFCSFIVPASVMRGDLCISISTGGASPALDRKSTR